MEKEGYEKNCNDISVEMIGLVVSRQDATLRKLFKKVPYRSQVGAVEITTNTCIRIVYLYHTLMGATLPEPFVTGCPFIIMNFQIQEISILHGPKRELEKHVHGSKKEI